jgi:chemotaxis protein methyltransferase CheR
MCRITISRFFRDRVLFERLRDVVLPDLIGRLGPEERELRAWSIGCASGEEAYSLRILWDLDLGPRCSPFSLQIAATDVDAQLLCRAAVAVYPASALREVPARWRERAFERSAGRYRLRDRFRRGVEFRERDVRAEAPAPEPRFHLVLCRNLVFTYFSEPLQLEVVDRLRAATEPGGALVVGTHERLPAAARGFMPWPGVRCVYRGHSSPLQ